HLLRDTNGIRALSRAIKNILDHGADARLRTLCGALDAYRKTVIRNRNAANAQKERQPEYRPESPTGQQGRRGMPAPEGQAGVVPSCEEVRTSRPPLEPVQPVHTRQRGRRGAPVPEVQAGAVASYKEVRNSRPPIEPVRPVHTKQSSKRRVPPPEVQVGEDIFDGRKAGISRASPEPLEPFHTEQRPRRRPTTRRQVQNPVKIPAKVPPLLSKRGSRVMQYD
ncbi:hypothetical protein LTR55_012212, partial [Exophiala xenobiotica]